MDKTKLNDTLAALIVPLGLVIALCACLSPRWETNDDVGMAMIAHGYGLVASGSPNLVFSNVIWGHLVRALPDIAGVQGYTVATMGILVIFGATMMHALRQFGANWLLAAATLALVLVRPTLFPQFTINSGLITVGAIVCWTVYAVHAKRSMLLAGCLLAFLGYLIRSQEFLLVLMVALPLLPWRKLIAERDAKIAALMLVAALAGAKLLDVQSYQSRDWQGFNAINLARAPYTDFGAGTLLLSRPDIYQKYGYSENDVRMLSHWGVYVDRKLAPPENLESMLRDIGFVPDQTIVLDNVTVAVKAFTQPALFPLAALLLIFLMCAPSARTMLAGGLFLLAVLAMGLFGRPGVARVYYPVLVLLLIFSFLISRNPGKHGGWRQLVLSAALFLGLSGNTYRVISDSLAVARGDNLLRAQIATFPSKPVIVWGAAFPYEAAYPVTHIPAPSYSYKLHGLGVFSPAPFSVAEHENEAGRGIAHQLVSQAGLPIIANDDHLHLLKGYCNERLNGALKVLEETQYGPVTLRTIRCET